MEPPPVACFSELLFGGRVGRLDDTVAFSFAGRISLGTTIGRIADGVELRIIVLFTRSLWPIVV